MSNQMLVEQVVPEEPGPVFASWVSAEGLATWWWPHIPDTRYRFDTHAGGSYEILSEAAGIGVRGEVLEIEEPSMIRLTWRWINDGVEEAEDRVHVTFTPRVGETLVTVRHQPASTTGEPDDTRQGWEDVLARLAEIHTRTVSKS